MTEDKKLYPNFSPKNKKNTLFFKLDRLSKRFKINKMALNKISKYRPPVYLKRQGLMTLFFCFVSTLTYVLCLILLIGSV